MQPAVSVIMAAYKARRTLGGAIASVKSQTISNWELLIIDDASNDGTYEFALSFAQDDHRIRVLRLENNGGPSAARNCGIENAEGQWITVLDADDAYAPDRIEGLLNIGQSTMCDIVFDNMASVTSAATRMQPYWPWWKKKPPMLTITEMLRGCSGVVLPGYGILKPFIKADFLKKNDIRYSPDLRQGEDVHFHLTMMLFGAIVRRQPSIGYWYTPPEANDLTRATNSNLDHRLKSTMLLRSSWSDSLSPSQKFWLTIRLLNTQYGDEYIEFRNTVASGRILKAAMLVAKQPQVLFRVGMETYAKAIELTRSHKI